MNIEAMTQAYAAIQIHFFFAVLAVFLGAFVLFRKKGTPAHKLAGRAWVFIMAATVLSSFFIAEIRLWGRFSPIHILSVLTAVELVAAVHFARIGQIKKHVSLMVQMYVFGLGIAGSFAFLPDRRLNHVFFGGDSWEGFFLVIGIVLIAILATLRSGGFTHWQTRRAPWSVTR